MQSLLLLQITFIIFYHFFTRNNPLFISTTTQSNWTLKGCARTWTINWVYKSQVCRSTCVFYKLEKLFLKVLKWNNPDHFFSTLQPTLHTDPRATTKTRMILWRQQSSSTFPLSTWDGFHCHREITQYHLIFKFQKSVFTFFKSTLLF